MTPHNEIFELAAIATITITTVYLTLFVSVISKYILHFSSLIYLSEVHDGSLISKEAVILFIKPSMILSFLKDSLLST